MPGVRDEYRIARRVLLDALEALKDHRDAVILVGAQAIYLHTGASPVAVAEFTTDADLALDPGALRTEPQLERAMSDAGFTRKSDQPGIWWSSPDTIEVDLLVPEAVAGAKGRGARLSGHGNMAARQAKGLEAALVDRQHMNVSALDPADRRTIEVSVAGPAALLVAKLHKIWERRSSPKRLDTKDSYDIYRLLVAIPTEQLAARLNLLLDDAVSADVTREALSYLDNLFSKEDGRGVQMAASHEDILGDFDTTVQSCTALAQDLLKAM